ncbi:MAG: uroporphyrinogen-III synthase [Sediminibacterium sp.]|nr:uroporphyrinogen-III synthase [Sediminibacterium sp.]
MPEHKIHILCTRPVEKSQVEKAKQKGIVLDAFSFIETEAIENVEVQQEIEWASVEEATVVFTSMNAVEAVTGMLDDFVPAWRIYCIGHRTKQLVTTYFGEHAIAGTADNASELADEIIKNDEAEEVIFFCGNQRREDLPLKLRKHNISVNEIIVYETIAIEHVIDKGYDGILFFSPSAVESFFSKNKIPEQTVLFAIGNTTAKTIHRYSNNRIMISEQPGKDELIEQAMEYFS